MYEVFRQRRLSDRWKEKRGKRIREITDKHKKTQMF